MPDAIKGEERAGANDSILSLNSVSKLFDGSDVFSLMDVDLTVKRHEFVCILGPNGCGKTTLLNLIAGFKPYFPHSSGDIVIDDDPIRGPGRDRVMVYQEDSLFPWLNVQDNIEFGLTIKGILKEEKEAISRRYLELMGLEEFRTNHPFSLSGGMKQKTELARAFAIKPKILLLDEPFAKLDAMTRYSLQEELLRISKIEKSTVIFVTHSVQEAVYLGDRVCIMTGRPGTILEEVTVDIPKPRSLSDTVTNRKFSSLISHLLTVLGKGTYKMPPDRIRERAKRATWIMLPFLTVLLLWQVLIWLRLFPAYLFPGPGMVAQDFVERVVLSQSMLLHIGASLIRLITGYALGIAAGLVMGVAMGLSGPIMKFFGPLFDFAHAIPGIAWLPIAILWLGIGFETIVFIVFLVVFFPVLYGTLTGIRTMSVKFSNVALMCGASKRQIIARVLMPGSLPSIMNGIRIGAAFGWRGLIASEMIIASSGIGWVIVDARSWLHTETVVLGAIVIGLLWICIDQFLLKTLEAKTIEKWGMASKL